MEILLLTLLFVAILAGFIYVTLYPPSDYHPAVLLIVLLLASQAGAELVTIERVIDGDTFVVSDGRYIRLHGIDCPELHQSNGGDAWMVLARKARGKRVELRNVQRAAWGRESAIVVIDGKDVALELLSRGLAYVDDRYCDKELRSAYDRAFESGRIAGLGVWAKHVPPWEFRGKPKAVSLASEDPSLVSPFTSDAVDTPRATTQQAEPWQQVTMYWTNNCGPCERTKPEFARVSQELMGNGYTFQSTGQRADAMRAGVQTYPTIIVRQNGREVRRFVGPGNANTLRSFLRQPLRVMRSIIQPQYQARQQFTAPQPVFRPQRCNAFG